MVAAGVGGGCARVCRTATGRPPPSSPPRAAPARRQCGAYGLINRAALTAHARQVPVPELQPGGTVVVDNPPSHKAPAVQGAIGTVGAKLLFFAPCSASFDLIEQVFSKLAAHPRKAAERAIHGPCNTIGRILDLHSPPEHANHVANAGYGDDRSATVLERVSCSLPTAASDAPHRLREHHVFGLHDLGRQRSRIVVSRRRPMPARGGRPSRARCG